MTQRTLGHVLRAWLSAHNKLSVGCGRDGLRKEVASSPCRFRKPEDRDHILKQDLGVHADLLGQRSKAYSPLLAQAVGGRPRGVVCVLGDSIVWGRYYGTP